MFGFGIPELIVLMVIFGIPLSIYLIVRKNKGSIESYNVYIHPTLGREAVKVGFSWPAFFFGIFWMLFKKLWGVAGKWFISYIVLSVLEKVTDQSKETVEQALVYLILSVCYFALWLIPAFKGNKWREGNLSKRGYEQFTTVQAETPDAAIALAVKMT
jgi:hypothetical protein